MKRTKHYLMTCAALFFLGMIVAKPGSTFQDDDESNCRLQKTGKMSCEHRISEYDINHQFVQYKFD